MEEKLKIVGISGSLRKDSYNRKALHIAMQIVTDAGMDVEEIDLKELNLPLYDADIEARGFPESVLVLRSKVESADVILIASPEYNHSITGVLKNTIDWLSTGKNVLDGKTAVIFGASTGPFGTLRAQFHLRQVLTALNVFLIPQPQVYIRFAKEAFNVDGSFNDPKVKNQLKELITKSLRFTIATKNLNKQ